MAIVIGSARHDERGKYAGGSAGDQLQKSSSNDTVGEVSMQNFYVHSKGWYVLRPKSVDVANKLAERMKAACNNPNIGYDQNQRTGVASKGINTQTKIEADCSSLVRQCVKEASGIDPGLFTTANEITALNATGLFQPKFKYKSATATPIFNGDVLVTCSKGHTAIVVSGAPRQASSAPSTPSTPAPAASSRYYPKYTGTSTSITTALSAVGEKDTSLANRKKIAAANGIPSYSGGAAQNTQLVSLLKKGQLAKAGTSTSSGSATASTSSVKYYAKCPSKISSLTSGLTSVGEPHISYAHRKVIAAANGVSNYSGTAAQNTHLLNLLKQGKLIKA